MPLTTKQHFEVYRLIGKASQKERLSYAQYALNELINDHITYADFQNAQAVERYAKKANRALEGLH